MIHLYIADIGALCPADAVALHAALPADIQRTVSAAVHPERFVARTVLRTMVCAHLEKGEGFLTDAHGAPRLSSGRAISMSHDGHLCVLALGDAHSFLGVDVQQHTLAADRAASIEKRFFSHLYNGPNLPISSVAVFYSFVFPETVHKSLQKDAFSAKKWDDFALDEDSFYTKWTRMEAILKSTGRGFEALPDMARLSTKTATVTRALTDAAGHRYTLTLAVT